MPACRTGASTAGLRDAFHLSVYAKEIARSKEALLNEQIGKYPQIFRNQAFGEARFVGEVRTRHQDEFQKTGVKKEVNPRQRPAAD